MSGDSLFLALDCRSPQRAPMQLRLDEQDEVVLAAAEEWHVSSRRHDGRRQLVVGLPGSHGPGERLLLVKSAGRWLAPARRSDGVLSACATADHAVPLQDGEVFSCEATVFLFKHAPEVDEVLPSAEAPPLERTEAPVLATLNPLLKKQFKMLALVARSHVPILVLGETGTGKELVARTIHKLSRRRGQFVAVNCGALPETLLQSELFGYRRGAFSGAVQDREGLVRASDGGTLFLDELGDLPLSSQAAFLRVLQESEVCPVGATKPIRVDLRVVTATNLDLTALVRKGRFRADLYARLLGFCVQLPPLRVRPEDIGLIVGNLVERFPAQPHRLRFTPAAGCALFRYSWPLNIRELEHQLTTAAILAQGAPIDVGHLAVASGAQSLAAPPRPKRTRPSPLSVGAATDNDELRETLIHLLSEHAGNVTRVASSLGKARVQIHRWARRYGIDILSFRESR